MKGSRRSFDIAILALILVCVAMLAACSRAEPTRAAATPPAAPAAPAAAENLPEANASAVIDPKEGGRVALKDGASVTIPANALSDTTVVNLSIDGAPPEVPIPRSLIGRAYEVSLEGGEVTGVTRIRLPLPATVTADQYDIAAFRWNGEVWERILGRISQGAFELGTNAPAGVLAVQGQWRYADADLSLSTVPSEPGRPTAPISVTGEYRYAALPTLQKEYVPARLLLKLDVSGGIGQITGDASADKTIAEATLLFQPNPAQAAGEIPFVYAFEIAPSALEIQPGASRYVYAVLIVDDSAAPTRRSSDAVEYTQILPIRVVGTEVVRPELQNEPPEGLRWHVRYNGQTMAQRPALTPKLPLAEFLALGGLGEYRISLETDIGGRLHVVSNEVQVVLTLPGTPTPTPTSTSAVGEEVRFTPGPVIGTPTPGESMPATPTRRTPPGAATATATPAPAASPTPQPTATATRPAWASVFWANRYTLAPGECATLNWDVQSVTSVFLNGEAVTGKEERQVCPGQTTTYTLSVTSSSGRQDYRLTIAVQESNQPTVLFSSEDYELVIGQCTTLHWETSDVNAVYLNEVGVPGVASQRECPEVTTVYTLRVVRTGSDTTIKSLTIKVLDAAQIPMRFWSEQYALATNQCTNLHWSVENVSEVYVILTGAEQGVAGIGTAQVCPTGPSQFYTLRAVTADGTSRTKRVTLSVFNPDAPGLQPNEVIAQGIVNTVNTVLDIDPNTAGDQPGYHVTIDGVYPLFRGAGDCCQAALTLKVAQAQAGDSMAEYVDWPVNAGQYIEFRGTCNGSDCAMPIDRPFYLKLRSN